MNQLNKKITQNKIVDERGCLIPFNLEELYFIPKRVFVVNNVPINSIRGNHSHFETEQFLICTNGSINVHFDYGQEKTIINLEKGDSTYIPKMVWSSQEFLTEDSEILVFCSTLYDASDYITNYKEYLKK
jgi:dTDP-4-dehydrorhamnose 3,5-epimerase-like enzyme